MKLNSSLLATWCPTVVMLIVVAAISTDLSGEIAPEGSEFEIAREAGADTTSMTLDGALSKGALAVWTVVDNSTLETEVRGQRFDVAGRKIGPIFQINSNTTGIRSRATVSADPTSGDFVVAWWNDDVIKAQRIGHDGVFLGGEFQVGGSGYEVGGPSVEVFDDGEFVVCWQRIEDEVFYTLRGQRFTSTGNPLGEIFDLVDESVEERRNPRPVADVNGGFLVVWTGNSDDGLSINARRFDSSANPVGEEFQVNELTTASQQGPAVAVHPSGRTLISWYSQAIDPDIGVSGRLYDGQVSPVSGEFLINTYVSFWQRAPSISVVRDSFVVSWYSDGAHDGDQAGVFAQALTLDGQRVGEEFQVNTYTTGWQSLPRMVTLSDDRFMVIWRDDPTDNPFLSGVQAQVFTVDAIFTDGFESGDVTAWSASN